MLHINTPKTDEGRINALNAFIDKQEMMEFDAENNFMLNEWVQKAKSKLITFNNLQDLHQQSITMKEDNDKKYAGVREKLTLYISHFIKVYNLAIIRGDLKDDRFEYYDLKDNRIPNLSSDEKILDWGKKLIEGERKRVFEGGTPMTNPTIASINIYYDKFTEYNFNCKVKNNYIEHTKNKLDLERQKLDGFIIELWNAIQEEFDKNEDICMQYGVEYCHEEENNVEKTDNTETNKGNSMNTNSQITDEKKSNVRELELPFE